MRHLPRHHNRGNQYFRIIRKRPGSTLIMVVSLLVIMGLVGTSFLASSRIDRGSSRQNVNNTQIDLLVEGARSMTIARVIQGLFGGDPDKPSDPNNPLDPSNPPIYLRPRVADNAALEDSPFSNDDWLASRLPDVTAAPVWPFISGPLLRARAFESPYTPTGSQVLTTAVHSGAVPTFLRIGADVFPAITVTDGGVTKTFLAADTDGDGIADSLLCPLPIGSPDGITYYVAIRILDNNSGINAAIAWKHNDDYVNVLPGDFFPTNVDLQTLLAGGAAEMVKLNTFRFNGLAPNLTPVDDSGKNRPDFAFNTPYEAAWMQDGRRPNNPGYNSNSVRYRALSSSDAAALAYRFMIRNPKMSPSTVEQCLSTSLGTSVPSQPFTPDQVASWATNFNFATNNFSRKTLMTAGNPTSNVIQLASINGPANPTPAHTAMLAYQGVNAKTSINTAAFPELFRAFWSVMAHTCGSGTFTTYFGNATNTSFNPYATDPALNPQRMFRSSIRAMPNTAGIFDATTWRFDPTQQVLLRSALAAINTVDLRDPDPWVTGRTVRLNAMTGATATTPVDVTVYGGERQPFITEVYAQTDATTVPDGAPDKNTKGYIAVELFNPYDTPLKLDSTWNIALLDRTPTSHYPDVPVTALTPAPFSQPVTIAPGRYLVLENYDPKGAGVGAAKYRPASSGLNLTGAAGPAADGSPVQTLYVQNLDQVFDREMILCRQVSTVTDITGATTAGSNKIEDMAPADQFDFTGMKPAVVGTAATPGIANLLHYCRESGLDASRWKCVYPGRYDATRTQTRQEGTEQVAWDPTTPEPDTTYDIHLGDADEHASYTNPFLSIQWCNVDQPGPYPVNGAVGNKFPFGGFARMGDILQVPFIGGYRIRKAGSTLPTVVEMNSVTMDCSFADDLDPNDDSDENVGRFAPTYNFNSTATTVTSTTGSQGGFNAAKAKPLQQTELVCKPSIPGIYHVENEVHGGLYATFANSLKCYFIPIQPTFSGTVEFVNCQGRDVTRQAGVHTDAFWFASGKSTAENLIVSFIDCDAHNISGMPFLWENGSCKRVSYDHCSVDWKYEIKLIPGNVIHQMVFDSSIGEVHFTKLGGKVEDVHVIHRPGTDRSNDSIWLSAKAAQDGVNVINVRDDGEDAVLPTVTPVLCYEWAKKVFDYFCVINNPNDDYLPNHSFTQYYNPASNSYTAFATPPQAVPNDTGFAVATANGGRENLAPAHGLININTAPWKVLAALPWTNTQAATDKLVQSIVAYRDQNGPFRTLFDIYNVPDVQTYVMNLMGADNEPNNTDGDLSPLNAMAMDGSRGDYEEKFLLINRVSNFLTTRSDSFTCYLLLQGFRDAGTPVPKKVVERRVAFTLDRSGVTPANKTPKVTNIPQDY